jgi:hypothetical protein
MVVQDNCSVSALSSDSQQCYSLNHISYTRKSAPHLCPPEKRAVAWIQGFLEPFNRWRGVRDPARPTPGKRVSWNPADMEKHERRKRRTFSFYFGLLYSLPLPSLPPSLIQFCLPSHLPLGSELPAFTSCFTFLLLLSSIPSSLVFPHASSPHSHTKMTDHPFKKSL